MIETLLLSILFVCAVIVVVSGIMMIREKMIIDSSIKKLGIPKSQFANLVLKWCYNRINHAQIKMPQLIVSYEKDTRIWGVYRPSKNEMVIYVHKHETIRELTNTIIHEFVHATQKNGSFNRSYDEFNKSLGYWNNPYEIESRAIAKDNEEECILELRERFRIFK
jgi:beta-lactamase regulating signal transducer with metallopeptidase domain